MVNAPPEKSETALSGAVTQNELSGSNNSITLGFRQASAMLAQLPRGAVRAVFATAGIERLKTRRLSRFANESELQVIFLPDCRPCVICGRGVGDINLGGYDGRSALTGRLYCQLCADKIEGVSA